MITFYLSNDAYNSIMLSIEWIWSLPRINFDINDIIAADALAHLEID